MSWKALYCQNQGRHRFGSPLENVKTSLWTFSSDWERERRFITSIMNKNLTFRQAHGLDCSRVLAFAHKRGRLVWTKARSDLTLTPLPNLESTSNSKRKKLAFVLQLQFERHPPTDFFSTCSPSMLGREDITFAPWVEKAALPTKSRTAPFPLHSRERKDLTLAFSSGGTGNDTHRVESRRQKLTFRYPVVSGARSRSKNPRRRRRASKAHFVFWRYDLDPGARFIRREFLTFASPF